MCYDAYTHTVYIWGDLKHVRPLNYVLGAHTKSAQQKSPLQPSLQGT